MPLPSHTAELFGRTGGQECVGARFHSPRPLWTEKEPLGLPEWPQEHLPTEWLCPTCTSNLLTLLLLLEQHEGNLPLEVRREFGNDLRALAFKGWRAHISEP